MHVAMALLCISRIVWSVSLSRGTSKWTGVVMGPTISPYQLKVYSPGGILWPFFDTMVGHAVYMCRIDG